MRKRKNTRREDTYIDGMIHGDTSEEGRDAEVNEKEETGHKTRGWIHLAIVVPKRKAIWDV